MKWTLLLFAVTLSLNAQSPVGKRSQQGESTTAKQVDPKVHADAVTLVEVSGARQRLRDSFPQMVDDAAKVSMERCQRCTPEFRNEWKKRMLERSNLQDYLDVYARVYEKYFTDAEINELIALQKDKGTSKAASFSPALKEKLTLVMPDVLADSMGDCAKIGAKLGGEIGAEIEREHPEYMKPPADQNSP